MGGRVSEQIHLGQMTTGAGNDLERVTDLARKMVCEWGMSDKLGPLTFGKKEEAIFLGREIAQHRDYSEATAVEIDREVKDIVLTGYHVARDLIEKNRESLIRIAEALLEREVLDAPEVAALVRGETLPAKPPVEPVRDVEPAGEAARARPGDRKGVVPAPGSQPA
jgi:cell division protease FtsH